MGKPMVSCRFSPLNWCSGLPVLRWSMRSFPRGGWQAAWADRSQGYARNMVIFSWVSDAFWYGLMVKDHWLIYVDMVYETSANLLHSYWTWPQMTVDLPIKDDDFHSSVSLPEGIENITSDSWYPKKQTDTHWDHSCYPNFSMVWKNDILFSHWPSAASAALRCFVTGGCLLPYPPSEGAPDHTYPDPNFSMSSFGVCHIFLTPFLDAQLEVSPWANRHIPCIWQCGRSEASKTLPNFGRHHLGHLVVGPPKMTRFGIKAEVSG